MHTILRVNPASDPHLLHHRTLSLAPGLEGVGLVLGSLRYQFQEPGCPLITDSAPSESPAFSLLLSPGW